jgi:hypothetical protein
MLYRRAKSCTCASRSFGSTGAAGAPSSVGSGVGAREVATSKPEVTPRSVPPKIPPASAPISAWRCASWGSNPCLVPSVPPVYSSPVCAPSVTNSAAPPFTISLGIWRTAVVVAPPTSLPIAASAPKRSRYADTAPKGAATPISPGEASTRSSFSARVCATPPILDIAATVGLTIANPICGAERAPISRAHGTVFSQLSLISASVVYGT